MSQASRLLGLGVAAVIGGIFALQACSSGGSGGDEPTAGSSNAGSSNGGSGGTSAGSTNGGAAESSAGAGDSPSQVVTACPGVVPPAALIADFNTAPAGGGKYEWGSAAQGTTDFWGGTFNYPDALMLSFDGGVMTAAGHVTEYAGFGLYVQNCADASSFEGVRFKIKGNPPLGKMQFAVQTNDNEWASGMKGACLAPDAQKFIDCVHPSVPIVVTADFTTIDVKWADLGMGKPAKVATTDGSDVIGLQFILPWTEKATPYDVSVSVDDIELIGTGAGAGGAGAGGAAAGGAGSAP